MTLYLIAKYLHLVGSLSLFVSLGLEWAMVGQLRRAQTSEQVREWARVGGWLRWLDPLSLGAILVPGFYMMATVWRGAPWIAPALVTLVIVAVLGPLGRRRLTGAIRDALEERGPLPAGTRARLQVPFPWISLQTRAALLLAIVFLMTAKSDRFAALWTIAAALLVSAAASVVELAALGSRAPSRQP